MVGIVLGEHIAYPFLPVFAGLVVTSLLLWRQPLWQSVSLLFCFVALGGLLMQRQQRASHVEWPQAEVRCEAVVMGEPAEKPKTMALDLLLTDGHTRLRTYIYKDSRSRRLHTGDGLRFSARIEQGRAFVPSWKWQKCVVSLGRLPVTERARLYFLKLRSRLLSRLDTPDAPADAVAVVAAMALGDKSGLTPDLKTLYAVTGASHVLALSGLHLGIIWSLLSLLTVGWRWRMASQLVVVAGMWTFVLLVGMPVSVVRAAVMLTAYALLSLGHRARMSVNTLAFTAMLVLMVSPQSLYDVGFQMSFMAVLSILLFVPAFEAFLPPGALMRHRAVRWLWGVVAVSCAAQLGVAPLVAFYFGRFSVWFLPVNFVVLPAAVLILHLSIAALILPSLTYLLYIIVALLNRLLGFIATLPGASIEGLHPTLLQVCMVYVIILALWLLLRQLAGLTYSPASGAHH